MSYFDDASLVMIPSGYKTSKVYSVKPTDGSGDLTFSRSNDTATRVNSAGLIEKVRTNVIPYSQAFDNALWIKDRNGTGVAPSVTANNATAPDGTLTADTIVFNAGAGTTTGDSSVIYQAITLTGSATASFYARVTSGTGQLVFRSVGGATYTTANLTTTWQRFSAAENGASGFFEIGIRRGLANEPINASVTVQMWGAQLEAGDIATDYIATTTAAVSVGPVANVPRLDYLNSSCPRLLLEPQRQNISGFIESGTGNYSNATVTNPTNPLSILGLRSFRVTSNYSSGDAPHISNATEYQSGTTYTASAYFDLSQTNATNVELAMFGFGSPNGSASARLNVSTKAVTTTATSGAWSAQSGKATLISGSIYRLEITATASQTFSGSRLYCAAADDAKYCEVAGIQIEAGAYATSFISKPTTAAVTRGADACSKTGISSLIGQTEGTVFVEFKRVPKSVNYQAVVSLQGASPLYLIEMYFGTSNTLVAAVYNNGAQYQTGTSALTEGTYKAALAYKENDFAFYVNGVQISTDNSGTVPALSTYNLGDFTYSAGSPQADGINQALLFKTRLTNAQLAELTTL